MAGKIVADTLEHSTAGSIATNYVVNGSAKHLVHYDQSGPTVHNSFNNSSVTDSSTGHFKCNYTSSFADAVYFPLGTGLKNTDGADSDRGGHSLGVDTGGTIATSSADWNYLYGASQSSASIDLDSKHSIATMGELA